MICGERRLSGVNAFIRVLHVDVSFREPSHPVVSQLKLPVEWMNIPGIKRLDRSRRLIALQHKMGHFYTR